MFIPEGRRRIIWFSAALLSMVVGLFLVFTRGFMPGRSLVVIAVVMLVAAIAGLIALAYGLSRPRAEKTKPKRELDMYSVMDRMVDDLDDDELAYLQHKLDERRHVKNDDLAQSIESLLDRRSQDQK